MLLAGGMSKSQVAKKLNISLSCVYRIENRDVVDHISNFINITELKFMELRMRVLPRIKKTIIVICSLLVLTACQDNSLVKFKVHTDEFTDKTKFRSLSFLNEEGPLFLPDGAAALLCFPNGDIQFMHFEARSNPRARIDTAYIQLRVDKNKSKEYKGHQMGIQGNNSLIYILSEDTASILLNELSDGDILKITSHYNSGWNGDGLSVNGEYKIEGSKSKVEQFKKECSIK